MDACLSKLTPFDEIVVVLDKTTDNSKNVAKNIQKKYMKVLGNLKERRNFGLLKCKGEWILEVDADELVPKKLFLEIRDKITHSEPGYFLIPFDNFIGKKKLGTVGELHGESLQRQDYHIKNINIGMISKEFILP